MPLAVSSRVHVYLKMATQNASPSDIAIHATDLALIAWCLFWLIIAVIVGLNYKRRPSIAVDLFILGLVGAHIFRLSLRATGF